jgi:hypothetical protein
MPKSFTVPLTERASGIKAVRKPRQIVQGFSFLPMKRVFQKTKEVKQDGENQRE